MIDLGDCLLAASGNPMVAAYSHDSALRPNVVGVFERPSSLTADQATWANELDKLVGSAIHPRGGAEKEEAKSLLRKSLEHPILSTIVGGAIDLIEPN